MRSTDLRRSILPALGAGLLAFSLVACTSAIGGEPTAPPASPAPATPAPATPAPATPAPAKPSPVVTPAPATPEPSDSGEDAMPINVMLDTTDGRVVDVDIVDYPSVIAGGASGRPDEGMSVEPGTIKVESVDATTLRLTWVDYAIDNDLTLYVYREDDGFRLVLIQPEPTGPVDATASDRELLLTFEDAIAVEDIEASLQDGIDTPND